MYELGFQPQLRVDHWQAEEREEYKHGRLTQQQQSPAEITALFD